MKKFIMSLVVVLFSLLTLGGCGEKEPLPPEPIQLTLDNYDDYIVIKGVYNNGYNESVLGIMDKSYADLDFQAYLTASGSCDNVTFTVRADLSDKTNIFHEDEVWHLQDSEDETKVEFTFRMPASGTYSFTYPIECYWVALSLKGNAKLEVVDVSGTFTPNS